MNPLDLAAANPQNSPPEAEFWCQVGAKFLTNAEAGWFASTITWKIV